MANKEMECCGSKGTTHKKGCSTLDTKPETTQDTPVAPEGKDIVNDISKDLSQDSKAVVDAESDKTKPVAVETNMIDLNNMTPDGLQALKSALDNVPQGLVKQKNKNSLVALRRMGGKLVVDFDKAYTKLVRDHESRSDKPKTHIDVRFDGEKEGTPVLYETFMSSERVKCEVISSKTEDREKPVGETFCATKKIRVPMLVRWSETTLIIKTPEGKKIEILSTKVNQ